MDSLEHGYSDSDMDQRRTLKDHKKAVVVAPSKLDTLGSSNLEKHFSAQDKPMVVRMKQS